MNIEDVISFGKVSNELATYLSLLEPSAIVLPSRGVTPFYETADALREYHRTKIEHQVVSYPFTADDSVLDTVKTRKHWVNVLKADCTGITNPHFEFFMNIEEKFADFRRTPVNLGKITFIDTAISGRSACEISDAMDEQELDYHMIIIAEKLKEPYKQKLIQLEHRGKVTLIPITKLYTEDQGIAMMGTTTVMLPNQSTDTMVASYSLDMPTKKLRFYEKPPILDHPVSYHEAVRSMHFYASQFAAKKQYFDDLELILPSIQASDMNSKEVTTAICAKLGNIEVTSSHVIKRFI